MKPESHPVIPIDKTRLDIISFGDAPDDTFYCLVDTTVSPDGLNVEKIKLTDPRSIDAEFKKAGCLLMLTLAEIQSLIGRNEIAEDNLHESLYELCREEGVFK